MGWLKNVIKERKLCSIWVDDERLYEMLAVDMGTTYIICEITTVFRCWELLKPLAGRFINERYRGKVEIVCK
jgi:hypothetical protein